MKLYLPLYSIIFLCSYVQTQLPSAEWICDSGGNFNNINCWSSKSIPRNGTILINTPGTYFVNISSNTSTYFDGNIILGSNNCNPTLFVESLFITNSISLFNGTVQSVWIQNHLGGLIFADQLIINTTAQYTTLDRLEFSDDSGIKQLIISNVNTLIIKDTSFMGSVSFDGTNASEVNIVGSVLFRSSYKANRTVIYGKLQLDNEQSLNSDTIILRGSSNDTSDASCSLVVSGLTVDHVIFNTEMDQSCSIKGVTGATNALNINTLEIVSGNLLDIYLGNWTTINNLIIHNDAVNVSLYTSYDSFYVNNIVWTNDSSVSGSFNFRGRSLSFDNPVSIPQNYSLTLREYSDITWNSIFISDKSTLILDHVQLTIEKSILGDGVLNIHDSIVTIALPQNETIQTKEMLISTDLYASYVQIVPSKLNNSDNICSIKAGDIVVHQSNLQLNCTTVQISGSITIMEQSSFTICRYHGIDSHIEVNGDFIINGENNINLPYQPNQTPLTLKGLTRLSGSAKVDLSLCDATHKSYCIIDTSAGNYDSSHFYSVEYSGISTKAADYENTFYNKKGVWLGQPSEKTIWIILGVSVGILLILVISIVIYKRRKMTRSGYMMIQ